MIKIISVFTLFIGIAIMGSVLMNDISLVLGSAMIGFSAGLMVTS